MFKTSDRECSYCGNKSMIIRLPDILQCDKCFNTETFSTMDGVLPYFKKASRGYYFRLKQPMGPWNEGRIVSSHNGKVMGVTLDNELTGDSFTYHFTDSKYFQPVIILLNGIIELN